MIVLFEPVFRILKAFNLDCNEFLILRFTSYEIAIYIKKCIKMLCMCEHHRVLTGFARTLLKNHFNENFHELLIGTDDKIDI